MVIKILFLFLFLIDPFLGAQTENEKCGTFRYVRTMMENRRLKISAPADSRPTLMKSILTKNQRIRIHYDTTGADLPAMVEASGVSIPNSYRQFIDTLQVLLDSVWNAEIIYYGFDEPPADDNRGGGTEYDFYVMNLSAGLFGETVIETDLPVGSTKTNQQYASYIRIDNNFGTGYRTKGVQAIMATIAHEFHHAVQVGGSGVWEEDHFYFYELCAEAMENTVFRDARDYLFDVKTYFNNLSAIPLFIKRSQTTFPGYERALWGMFLMKKFGTDIMKDVWAEIKKNRPAAAMNNVLNDRSTTIQREFADFSFWNFYTAHRADSIHYYPDAKRLPLVAFTRTTAATQAVQEVSILAKSFVINYYKITLPADSAFFIVANTNLNDVINDGQPALLLSKVLFSSSASSGYPLVSNSIYGAFNAEDPQLWSYSAVGTQSRAFCFPNPFNPATSSLLIPVSALGSSGEATLSVYSANDLDLIYSDAARYVFFSGIQYAEWKGRDMKEKLVASGVYVYVLSKGSTVIKGKFAVIR